ncbi:MAG: hypothetical protein M3161_04980 [Actinomycetota bacterium]|nr:hypothetical protein [Actinomycetota bacterium]
MGVALTGPLSGVVNRIAALSGFLGTIVIVMAGSLSDPARAGVYPAPTLDSDVVATLFARNSQRGRLGAQLMLLGAFLMLWFGSYLFARLRRAEGAPTWSSALVLAGTVVLVTFLLVEAGFGYAASELSEWGTDTQPARMISLWGWNSAVLLAPGSAAVLLGCTIAGLRDGAIPRGLAVAAGLGLVLLLLIAVLMGAPGLAASIGGLWVAVASLVLGLKRDAEGSIRRSRTS